MDDEVLSVYSSDSEAFNNKKLPSEDSISNHSRLDDFNSELFEQKTALHEVKVAPRFKENRSVTSLKSSDSIPAFLGAGNMKKWTNFEDLDELSDGARVVGKWEVGDTTDTGMFQFLLMQLLMYLCKKLLLYSVYIVTS